MGTRQGWSELGARGFRVITTGGRAGLRPRPYEGCGRGLGGMGVASSLKSPQYGGLRPGNIGKCRTLVVRISAPRARAVPAMR